MRRLVCPSFLSFNINKNSQDYGEIIDLANKHIYIIEDFNEDGTIKGQIIKTIADKEGKLYKGNSPVPLNPGNYYFYVSDKEVEDVNKITKTLCTDEVEITDEFEQLVDLTIENVINEITINVNAYIVEGAYWDENKVNEQLNITKTIFNKHFEQYNFNVRLNFNIAFHKTVNSNLNKIELSGNVMGTLNNDGIDTSMSSFNYIFNFMITDPNIADPILSHPSGVNIEKTTTAIISILADTIKTTTAHETGHIFGLYDLKPSDDFNNLMYWNSAGRSKNVNEITLTQGQMTTINNKLLTFSQNSKVLN